MYHYNKYTDIRKNVISEVSKHIILVQFEYIKLH